MSHTHALAEWFAVLSLGLSLSSAASVPFWLTYDAEFSDFDPRPAARCCVHSVRVSLETGALVPAWEAAIDAGHSLNWTLRHVRTALHPSVEACRDLAALLILLCTSPKGAMA